ncbi:MAG: superfamily drug/metaboltie permease [Myxococcaceae bacterium]|nr:superfamily drug/metaboltie permease [Myxococcaceae bacterium]
MVTHGLLLLLCLVWGSTWLVVKLGLRDVPPFTAATMRFVVAGLCMAVLARLFAAREGGGRPPRLVVLAHGTCQFALNFGLVYVGETVIPSGLVAVLWAVFPIFVALGGHFVLKSERISLLRWVGFAVSFAGVLALFVTDLAAIDARAVTMGLLVLLAPLSVSVSTLLVKQRASGTSSLLLNRDAMLIGATMLGTAAFLFESPLDVVWTELAVWSVIYLALVGTVVAFGVYMWLLRYVPASRMSMTSFVLPVIALLLGAAVGGEPLGPRTLLGTALVLGGVSLASLRARVG